MQLDEQTFTWFLFICFIFTFSRLRTFVSFSSLWSYLLNKFAFINFTSLILVFADDSEDAQTHLASAGSISLQIL